MSSISLLHGWAPIALQAIAAVALVFAIGRRSRRWQRIWLPVSIAAGIVVAALTYWFIKVTDMSGGVVAPVGFWIWVGLAGLALVVLVLGWREAGWWRRAVSLLAVPLTLVCVALAVNQWTAYFPTVQSAWGQFSGHPLPGQTDEHSVDALRDPGGSPEQGKIVTITVPDGGSDFKHRDELVYLPPAWFASDPPPTLPAIMLVGGEFGSPNDWLRAGNAQQVADEFAAAHGGQAPVLVFVDAGGAFRNDTECVDGVRGNAAAHLTNQVVPYVVSRFGVSSDPANWAVAGWSMGGTCAVTLAVKYPELFSAFLDIDGDLFPNAGTREQSIARLFGGDEAAFDAFDPTAIIPNHGLYQGMAGWFSIVDSAPPVYRPAGTDPSAAPPLGPAPDPRDHSAAANHLCELGSQYGIECAVVAEQTEHDWQGAAKVLAEALPWLAGKIGSPGAPPVPLPGAPAAG